MKRAFCILLTLCFILPAVALAEAVPYSNEIERAICELRRDGDLLTATATLRTPVIAEVLKITSFSIQEYQNGKWVVVKSVSNVLKYDSRSLSKTLAHTGKSGCKYRAVAKFSATVNGVTATESHTSTTK